MADALLGLSVLILFAMTVLAILGTMKYRPHPKMPKPIRVGWRIVQAVGFTWPAVLVVYTLLISLAAIGRAARLLLGGE